MLADKGYDVIVVDKDPKKAEAIAREADVEALARDATDPSLYEREVDLTTVDVVVAVTNRDEVNMFVATLAREYDVPRIIVRVRDSRIAYLIQKLGIEHVIVEPLVTANMINSIIEGKYVAVNIVPTFTGNYRLVSITISEGDTAAGKPLEEIQYPRDKARIIAVFDGRALLDPSEVARLEPGYQVIALVRQDSIEEFLQAFR
jgi:trk system potassium uptake protein TrkA